MRSQTFDVKIPSMEVGLISFLSPQTSLLPRFQLPQLANADRSRMYSFLVV
jgi:hypothetical protein